MLFQELQLETVLFTDGQSCFHPDQRVNEPNKGSTEKGGILSEGRTAQLAPGNLTSAAARSGAHAAR